jgi:hypothetical protein
VVGYKRKDIFEVPTSVRDSSYKVKGESFGGWLRLQEKKADARIGGNVLLSPWKQ